MNPPHAGNRSTDVRSFPRRTRRAWGPLALLLLLPLLLLLILMIGGCGSNQAVLDHPIEQDTAAISLTDSGDAAMANDTLAAADTLYADTLAAMSDSAGAVAVAAEIDSTVHLAPGQSIGERLGQLDALMKNAPPDSLPILQAEYQRLLAQAAPRPQIQTGNPSADTAVNQPVFEMRPDLAMHPDDPMFDSMARDPSRLFKGLRPSELRTAPGYVARLDSHQLAIARARASARLRASADARGRAGIAPEQPTMREPRSDAERRAAERRYIDGLAASRSGDYHEAAEKLAPVVSNRTVGNDQARYAYAMSLEKTGRISEAAEQYRIASQSGSALAHKSYISYCRMLARLGQSGRAKQLVLQFIKQHPDSSQVVTARRLLQTL